VTALDASASRLGRLRENLQRTHLEALLIEADALKWQSQEKFDAILLDAPCSATGTFRRHPEVLYRARPSLIAEGADRQGALLDQAIRWLKPDGVLVYSVCSLEPAEGEQVIEQFLAANSDFHVQAAGELPDFVQPSEPGWVRILPGLIEEQGGLDGFFMARLVRRG
jgi:16S rRNA (cytosine967-C5)-methyltransferase